MKIAFSFLSLLNKDYLNSIKEFNELTNNSEWIHYDVMDGVFVENTTYDYQLVKNVTSVSNSFNDLHLMINNPSQYIKDYVDAGVNQITFHYESVDAKDIINIINEIKKYNVKVGISIKPNTDVKVLDEYLMYLDNILIMSVEPGKGGQKFIEDSIEKIKYLKHKQSDYKYLISVDGGINENISKIVKEAGADIVIVGTYLADNLNKETIEKLK